MEQTRKMRGGYRAGAGRKPKDNRTQTVSFSASPELIARINTAVTDMNISRSQLIVRAIEAFLQ